MSIAILRSGPLGLLGAAITAMLLAGPTSWGRPVSDNEASTIFGGQTTEDCGQSVKKKNCDTDSKDCVMDDNFYDLTMNTIKVSTYSYWYCGAGESCGVRVKVKGCDVKK